MISSIQDPGDGRHARPLHHALPAVEGTSWARHARDGRWGWDAPAGVIVVSSMDYPHMNLVGGFKPSEKYEFVNWDDYSQYMGK